MKKIAGAAYLPWPRSIGAISQYAPASFDSIEPEGTGRYYGNAKMMRLFVSLKKENLPANAASLTISTVRSTALRYQSDKYKDVIIPMVIIRRFECALAPTKAKVVETYKANPGDPAKAMYRLSGFQFYNTSEFDLAELVNDSDHLAANFKAYIQGFSANIQDIIRSLDFDKQIDKMDKNNRLLSVVKAFSELDLNPRTIDNVKMGYIFEDLIRKFSENAEAGDHYTGRDIIKLMVNILLAEGCDDIFDDGKVITVLDITWLIFLVAPAVWGILHAAASHK